MFEGDLFGDTPAIEPEAAVAPDPDSDDDMGGGGWDVGDDAPQSRYISNLI